MQYNIFLLIPSYHKRSYYVKLSKTQNITNNLNRFRDNIMRHKYFFQVIFLVIITKIKSLLSSMMM